MSKVLNIIPPKVIYIQNGISFYSQGILHIKLYEDVTKTLFLALHELRHYYQECYIKSYKNDLTKLIEYEMNSYNELNYNDLFIEMDAYAFAYYVMVHFIHIDYKPSLIVKEMIFKIEKDFSLIYNYKRGIEYAKRR